MSDRVKTTDTEVKTHQHGMTGFFRLVPCDPERISDVLFFFLTYKMQTKNTQAHFIYKTDAIFICREEIWTCGIFIFFEQKKSTFSSSLHGFEIRISDSDFKKQYKPYFISSIEC